MNQVLFRVVKSIELLSNRVLDLFPSGIDGEINGFAWVLEVNNGGRERAPALLWTCSSEEEEAGDRWEGRGKVYIYPLASNGHLNHR